MSNLINKIKESYKTNVRSFSLGDYKEIFEDNGLSLVKLSDAELKYLYDICKHDWFIAEMSDSYSVTLSEQRMIPKGIVEEVMSGRGLF